MSENVSTNVRTFADIGLSDIEEVGGKNASLGEMIEDDRRGQPVQQIRIVHDLLARHVQLYMPAEIGDSLRQRLKHIHQAGASYYLLPEERDDTGLQRWVRLVLDELAGADATPGSGAGLTAALNATLDRASRDGEIRLTYAELTALIADAVKHLRD